MILSGVIGRAQYGDQEVLSIGENPVAEYFQSLNGKTVNVTYAHDERPFPESEMRNRLNGYPFTGIVDAELVGDDSLTLFPEKVFIGDSDLLEELYEIEGDYIILIAQEEDINLETAFTVPVVQENKDDPVLAELVFALITKSPILYQDNEYLVVQAESEFRYYRINNGVISRIGDIIPLDLVNRLARAGRPVVGYNITQSYSSNL